MSKIVLDPQVEAALRKTFNIAGAEMAAPTELSDTVQFVHPVLGGGSGQAALGQLQLETVVGIVAATSVLSSAVPAAKYRWVLACSMIHSDGVATHQAYIAALLSGGQGPVLVSAQLARLAGAYLVVPRPFLLSVGGQIQFAMDLNAVGQITASFSFLELDLTTPFPLI